MSEAHMRRFWDRRAREDPYYFVDNRLDYGAPDVERFWADGERVVEGLTSELGTAISPTDRVVEIGCGIGRVTRAIAARAAEVVAVDVSEEMLVRARELNPHLSNVRWLLGDGATLARVDSESADACISFVVFQHIPDPAVTMGYVREMGRVLRPGGWAGFQVSNDPDVHRPRATLGHRALAAVRRAPGGQTDPAWLGSAVDLDELRLAASEAGMQTERVVRPGTQWCEVLLRR